jgi:hypothetical protein
MAEPFLRLTILKKGRGWKFPDLTPALGESVRSDALVPTVLFLRSNHLTPV